MIESSNGEMLKVKKGLGGWLILVAIGVIFSPLRIIAELNIYLEIFNDGTWEALTLQSSEFYNPLFGVIVCFEIIGNCALVIAYIYLIFLFFKEKQNFPKIYIITILANTAFILIDALFCKVVFPTEPMFDAETTKMVVQSVVACAIWIPYMRMSVRVKNTFINL